MNTKLASSIVLFLVIVASILITPKYVYWFFDTNIGKIVLLIVLIFMSYSSACLGLLFALLIILISKEFRNQNYSMQEYMTNNHNELQPAPIHNTHKKHIYANVNPVLRQQNPKPANQFLNTYSKATDNTIPNEPAKNAKKHSKQHANYSLFK